MQTRIWSKLFLLSIVLLSQSPKSSFGCHNCHRQYFARKVYWAYYSKPYFQRVYVGRHYYLRPVYLYLPVVKYVPVAYHQPIAVTPVAGNRNHIPVQTPVAPVPMNPKSRTTIDPTISKADTAIANLKGSQLYNQANAYRNRLVERMNRLQTELDALSKKGITAESNPIFKMLKNELEQLQKNASAYQVLSDLSSLKTSELDNISVERKRELAKLIGRMEWVDESATLALNAVPSIRTGKLADITAALTTSADQLKAAYASESALQRHNPHSLYLAKNANVLAAINNTEVTDWGTFIRNQPEIRSLVTRLQNIASSLSSSNYEWK